MNWIKTVKIPEYLDGDYIDKHFSEEVKQEIKKIPNKQEEKIETIKLKTFCDDKRSQKMSILLSRFPYSTNDVYKILINFKTDILEYSKK